jgi:hypothetical protein
MRWPAFIVVTISSACVPLDGLTGDASVHSPPSDGSVLGDGGADGDAEASSQVDALTDAPPPRPLAFVQANAGGTSTATTVQLSFAAPITAHNALVVAIDDPTTQPVLSDSLGNQFTFVVVCSTLSPPAYIALAQDIRGGPDTVTVTADITQFNVYIHEYSGFTLTNAFDNGNGGSGNTSGTDGILSASIPTSGSNELLFGFGIADVVASGTGFAPRSNYGANITEDRIVAMPSVVHATATMTSGSGWTMLAAAFRGQ